MLGPLFAVLSAFGSSVKAILIKLAYEAGPVDAVTLLALRMIFAAPFFLGIAWWWSRGQEPLPARDWAKMAGLGFCGFYLASYLDFWGLEMISVGLERVLLFTYPVMVAVISAVWLKRPLRRTDTAALVTAFAGIALVFGTDLREAGSPARIWTGGLLVVGASMAYGVYLLGSGQLVARIGSFRMTGVVISISSLFVIGQFLLTHPVDRLIQPARVYWLAFGMAMVSTVLPIVLVAEAIKRIGAARTSIISFLGPILTIWLARIFLGETLAGTRLAGTALVVAGVALASRREAKGAGS